MDPTIPPPHPGAFTGAIAHPDLYLWDSWSFQEANETHLYCLAISRTDETGQVLEPSRRNERPFHVRHFLSQDLGASWTDEGCFQTPRYGSGQFDSNTIWSGSVTLMPDGKKLVAYTGIRDARPEQPFQQSISVAVSDCGYTIRKFPDEPVSCPIRDWKTITGLGYYLDDVATLGHRDGESGGPIMAWRDPFGFLENDTVHLFWGAKTGSLRPAMAHATVEESGGNYALTRLYEPVTVPDCDEFTQLELPKVLRDNVNGRYYLLISTCNRRYEGQSDAEVDKRVRLYSSKSIHGPWQPAAKDGSTIIKDDSFLFGLTVLSADFEKGELRCVSPYTDAAPPDLQLTVSGAFTISLGS